MKKRIVAFTGAGISAESGISTFRGIENGLWYNYNIDDVATASAWKRKPELVLEFHNMLRAKLKDAQPNIAHKALAVLDGPFDVVVVSQNVDDLHERGGSKNVFHLHGELYKSRSTFNPSLMYECLGDLNIGDKCEKGSQLRPHTVLFDEMPYNVDEAISALREADVLLIIGTSLQISYTLGLLNEIPAHTEIIYIDPEPVKYLETYGMSVTYVTETATKGVVEIALALISQDLREQTFHMDDEEARVVVDKYISDNPSILELQDREWFYKNV